jgi:hypothetical protein
MSELEQRLGAALGADAPPARDALFRLEVLVRRERARFKRQLGRALAAVFAAALLVGVKRSELAARQLLAGDIGKDLTELCVGELADLRAEEDLRGA